MTISAAREAVVAVVESPGVKAMLEDLGRAALTASQVHLKQVENAHLEAMRDKDLVDAQRERDSREHRRRETLSAVMLGGAVCFAVGLASLVQAHILDAGSAGMVVGAIGLLWNTVRVQQQRAQH